MRIRKWLFAALFAGLGLALGTPDSASAQPGAVNIAVFHEQLAPYGRWVVAGSYGNVWVPQARAGWAPYVDGQWVYTSYGWTWESDDPWGGVPCHYGSWAWVDPYGWVWTPGTVWAPAWVTWAYTDDYIGWAPIPPSFGFGVTGYVGAPVVLATARYCFVPTRQFVGVRVASVRVPVARNEVIFTKAVKTTEYRVTGGVVRTAGPPPARIEKVTQHKVAEVSIDRVRTRPTTLAEGGVAKASRIAPVAPAAEREKIAAKPGSETNKQTHKQVNEPTRQQAKASEPVREKAKAPEAESTHPVQSAERAPAKPHKAPKHEPATPAEKPSTSTAERAHPPAQPKTKASSEGQAKARPQEEHPPTRSNQPTEETHVASHEVKAPPAHGHSQAAPAPKAKPKPPEKKPEPPRDEKPE